MTENKEQDRRLKDLEDKMEKIFDHIAVTNSEMGKIQTDVAWIKKGINVIFTTLIGTIGTLLLNFFLR